MAESNDIKDEGEADPGAADENVPSSSLFGGLIPREKPVIEGRAEEIPSEPSSENRAEADAAADVPFDDSEIPLPPGTHVSPPETEEPDAASTQPEAEPIITPAAAVAPPRRGGFVWPLALAIVVGAGLAVGGAWGLRQLDDTSAKIAALDERLAAAEQKQDMASVLGANLPELKRRVTALETESQSTQADAAGLRADLTKLEKAHASPPVAAGNAPPDLAPLEARVAALEQKFGGLDTKLGGLAGKFDEQKSQVRATEDRAIQSNAAREDNVAIAILAAGLLRKVEAGAPFAAELSALGNRGIDKAKLVALEPAATSGVPTAAALSKQFSGLSDAILASEPAPRESGFFGHLMQGAEKLVRIEKIGDTSGHDLASQVTRIQASLDAGSIDAAYQEWTALPAAAKAKSQAFGEAAKRRIDAIAAAQAIDADAMAALGKPKS